MRTGGIEALVIDTRHRGPHQMAGAVTDLIDQATGGAYTATTTTLDQIDMLLKATLVASVISGIAAIAVLIDRRR